MKFKGNFVQGNPDGQQIFYYENGKMKEEEYFQMGIRQKTRKKFSEDGTPFLVISYKDDVEISINGVKIKLPESDAKLIK
jgi:antitoxin component YwqK of YwqJK toxin-antitoxin module